MKVMRMQICIVGLGSMGNRRIKLIIQAFNQIEIIGVDHREDRRIDAVNTYDIRVYATLEEVMSKENLNAVFICTSPLEHPLITQKCLEAGLHVFSEINLVNTNHDLLIELAKVKGLVLFLSSTPMYRREIMAITDNVKALKGVKCYYQYHVGQYLPDWHPWENYKDFFASDNRTNGCREIFAIELPWIINAFGGIERIIAHADNITKLNLAYPDAYSLIIKHISGHWGVVSIDVASRKAIRNLEIVAEGLHLFWDGTVNGLKIYDIQNRSLNTIILYEDALNDNRYAENIIEDPYLEEISAFLDAITGNNDRQHNDFSKDKEILNLIDSIEDGVGFKNGK